MFSLDNRTGNVVTTVALFLIGAAVLYLARRSRFTVSEPVKIGPPAMCLT